MSFYVAPTTPPSMAVRVGSERGWHGAVDVIVAAADRVWPRVDCLSVDPAGMLTVATGVAAPIPHEAVVPVGYRVLAYLSVPALTEAITSGMITLVGA